MKSSIVFTLVLALAPTIIAAPIDFDNLHIASSGYGIVGDEGRTRLMAAYNNKIYFFIREDGTATPSKFYCYDPSNGWGNSTNLSMVAETTGFFGSSGKCVGLLQKKDIAL